MRSPAGAQEPIQNVTGESYYLERQAMKKNCWELIFCGREPGGVKAAELGVCPAASDPSRNNVNGGKNGGRYCWKIAGTLCGGAVQGNWASKIKDCSACKFFQFVETQEGEDFIY